tara:strand:- start:2317 stop:2550 length:234 start_codon:yes stop_codon:yes gene_type:complete
MACKNCKSAKSMKTLDTLLNNPPGVDAMKSKENIMEQVWDKTLAKLNIGERLIILVLCWFPLIIGYITIIKFIISIF